jgi:uncharacterized membrane protein YbhN (UPF0104 family)
MATSPEATDKGSAHHRRLTRAVARSHVEKVAIRVLVIGVLAVLVLKLVPGLETAVSDLSNVSVPWLVGAVALEVASEIGYVTSWRAIVDPEDRLSHEAGVRRMATRLAWAQLGGGTLVPAGSFGALGVGGWFLSRLGMPAKQIAERLLALSLLNTAVDALMLLLVGVGLAIGVLPGSGDLALTLLPAALAAGGLSGTLVLARRMQKISAAKQPAHEKRAAVLGTLSQAVVDVDRFVFHGERGRSLVGAVAYLGFDLLVLWTAFLGIHASPVPHLGVVVMAYIIGALGGSLPFIPAGAGAAGGIGGMLILYGIHHGSAVAAVIVYEAIGLLVPFVGGGLAFLLVRRHLEPLAGETA